VEVDTLVLQQVAEVPGAEDLVGMHILGVLVHQDKDMQVEMDIGHLVEITEFLEAAAVLEDKDPHLHTALSKREMVV
jgi:hypothetical protein